MPPGNQPAPRAINTTLIEVGVFNNGQTDEHARAVKEVFLRSNPGGSVQFQGIGLDASEAAKSTDPTAEANKRRRLNGKPPAPIKPLADQVELNQKIDDEASDTFNIVADRISQLIQEGQTDVINGSLGYSRNTIYENTLLTLHANPQLASAFGLQTNDVTSLQSRNGEVLATDKVADAVVRYVDGRLDSAGSAYNQSKAKYQQVTKQAADKGIVIVVAAGNEHDLNSLFNARQQGGDTNFLAQSEFVISAAASDDKGTPTVQDDTIAPFSSRGDGQFNPTVAADGVDVKTSFGTMDGTSFSAPQVAGLVARLKQINFNLSFGQIKALLQRSATDIIPNNIIADGAGVINPSLALQLVRQPLGLMA